MKRHEVAAQGRRLRRATELRRLTASGRNFRGVVHQELRDRIVRLELAPGAHLSENELSRELGVSRTPVRESLILLAEEGLVTVLPQVGSFVAPIDLGEITTAQFVRESLECAAIERAAQERSEADLSALEVLLDQQVADDRAQDNEAFFGHDEDFHARLMVASGFGSVWRTVGQAKAQLDRARRLSLGDVQSLATLVEQHRAILERLRERDGAGAVAALREHLRQVFTDVAQLRERRPELFAED
ncbi:GntR family transcriptional regulator [Georgenia alba]|uniref:GntR family transcriptional regulator n=1 Tax=Georgenia alba TaxID=2233858 RepID=A0ABW2Q4C3_9MICO